MKFAIRNSQILKFFYLRSVIVMDSFYIYFAFNKIEQIRGEQYRDQENIFVDLLEFNFPLPAGSHKVFNRNGETIMIVSTDLGTRYLVKVLM